MSYDIIGNLKTVRSNYSLGLLCFGVLSNPKTKSIILKNRVIIREDGLNVIPPNSSLTIPPNEIFYEVSVHNWSKNKMEQANMEFAKMFLRNLTLDSFEAIRNYCDRSSKKSELEAQTWYWFTHLLRNALTHNQHWEFSSGHLKRMPVTWRDKTIDASMDGKELTFDFYDWYDGVLLWEDINEFAMSHL